MENSKLLKVTGARNKTAAEPEARTSCLRDRDTPAESAVGWMGQSYLCRMPGALTFIRLEMGSKVGQWASHAAETSAIRQTDSVRASDWLPHTFTEYSQTTWKSGTLSLQISFLATVGEGGQTSVLLGALCTVSVVLIYWYHTFWRAACQYIFKAKTKLNKQRKTLFLPLDQNGHTRNKTGKFTRWWAEHRSSSSASPQQGWENPNVWQWRTCWFVVYNTLGSHASLNVNNWGFMT